MAHALVVTQAALSNLAFLWYAPASVKLGSRFPLENNEWLWRYPYVGATGELFTTWLLYDIVSVVYAWADLGSWETIVHHFGFLIVAAVLRGFYFAPWQSTVCLAMESSTPFLNVVMMREAFGLEKSDLLIKGSFMCFGLNFFIFRILLLGSALLHVVVHFGGGPWWDTPAAARQYEVLGAPRVPLWAGYMTVVVLIGAGALMLMWFQRIVALLISPPAQKLPAMEIEVVGHEANASDYESPAARRFRGSRGEQSDPEDEEAFLVAAI